MMNLSINTKLAIILCIFFNYLETTNSAKILILNAFSSKSHMNIFYPLIDGLHSRGHEVVVYSSFVDKKNHPNITQIQLRKCNEYIVELCDNMLNASEDTSFSSLAYFYKDMMMKISTLFFEEPEVQQLIKEKPHYDLFITDILFNDFIFPMSYHIFKAPAIYVSTSILLSGMAYDFNIPRPYSYVPDEMTTFSTRMSFTERLSNAFTSLMSLYLQTICNSISQEQVSRYLKDAPSIEETKRNGGIILVNSDPVLDSPAPLLPNIINIGCIHCHDAKPIPKELEDFVEGSGEEGFIYFSLGSVMKGSLMPNQAKAAFIKAFSQIKQRVLWKFEETIDDLPSNVKLIKWASQQDILGHSKIRLFITHNGLLGTQEATYHGVPMLGLPVFADQALNNARVREKGFGEKLNIYSITSEEIVMKMNKLLYDKRYKEAAVKCSILMRDREQKPLDSAIFWSEYVIRHKGSQHLIVAAKDLNTFQYFLLDVILFIGCIVIFVILILFIAIKFIIQFIKSKLQISKSKFD